MRYYRIEYMRYYRLFIFADQKKMVFYLWERTDSHAMFAIYRLGQAEELRSQVLNV